MPTTKNIADPTNEKIKICCWSVLSESKGEEDVSDSDIVLVSFETILTEQSGPEKPLLQVQFLV